jgi:glycosyltransferase involved in cell wall biosynthesis
MSAHNPLVSIVIPVYNAGQYLRPAVESVLDQTYRNLEVIIIDDGSTDGAVDSIADLKDTRLRIVRQDNAGKPAAMNRALSIITGEFYAINDADDLSHPSRIERQVRCLQENPFLAAVFCGHEIILNGRTMAPQFRAKNEQECRADIDAFRMPAHDPTGLFRLSAVGHLKYELSLGGVEGYDYILRVGEQLPMRVLGECLYAYRIHEQSITRRAPEVRNQRVRAVLRRACERRGLRLEDIAGPEGATPETRHRNQDADNNLAAHFIESVLDLRASGQFLEALKTGLHCVWFHPADPHYSKALAYSLLPQALVRKLRRKRAQLPPPAPASPQGSTA